MARSASSTLPGIGCGIGSVRPEQRELGHHHHVDPGKSQLDPLELGACEMQVVLRRQLEL